MTRVEKYKKRLEDQLAKDAYASASVKSNSYSQNLTHAILHDQKAFVWLMKLFHRDELDIQRSQPLSKQEIVE